MCGIAAIIKEPRSAFDVAVIRAMVEEVAHRGPDHEEIALLERVGVGGFRQTISSNSSWNVGMGHRRLSVLDLSAAAHQPMSFRDSYWIIYNGEVYNFIELREQLRGLGYDFRTRSDTEVILAAYAEWGPECFPRLRGMWAMVVIDGVRNQVILCRDRLGIKPLYFWEAPGLVAVASELKQFRHLPGFGFRMDPETCALYLTTSYEDPKRTFFADIQPLPAGTWVSISMDTLERSEAQRYWYPEKVEPRPIDPGCHGQ